MLRRDIIRANVFGNSMIGPDYTDEIIYTNKMLAELRYKIADGTRCSIKITPRSFAGPMLCRRPTLNLTSGQRAKNTDDVISKTSRIQSVGCRMKRPKTEHHGEAFTIIGNCPGNLPRSKMYKSQAMDLGNSISHSSASGAS